MTALSSSSASLKLARLRQAVLGFAELLERAHDEALVLERGEQLLGDLIAHDDWLPRRYAAHNPARYQQYLLHCDSAERFSMVSFAWGPGQATPIHDHRVWGLVGVLRGAELDQRFARNSGGELAASRGPVRLEAGSVAALSPRAGDVHRVANAEPERTSVSIHVYGGNIGAVERATYDASGARKPFVSGYANRSIPNLWDRTAHR
jgi:predicted metal-dependent enzyme (double-stranded beta helix superfamily)